MGSFATIEGVFLRQSGQNIVSMRNNALSKGNLNREIYGSNPARACGQSCALNIRKQRHSRQGLFKGPEENATAFG
jgi:hypothetical protein